MWFQMFDYLTALKLVWIILTRLVNCCLVLSLVWTDLLSIPAPSNAWSGILWAYSLWCNGTIINHGTPEYLFRCVFSLFHFSLLGFSQSFVGSNWGWKWYWGITWFSPVDIRAHCETYGIVSDQFSELVERSPHHPLSPNYPLIL